MSNEMRLKSYANCNHKYHYRSFARTNKWSINKTKKCSCKRNESKRNWIELNWVKISRLFFKLHADLHIAYIGCQHFNWFALIFPFFFFWFFLIMKRQTNQSKLNRNWTSFFLLLRQPMLNIRPSISHVFFFFVVAIIRFQITISPTVVVVAFVFTIRRYHATTQKRFLIFMLRCGFRVLAELSLSYKCLSLFRMVSDDVIYHSIRFKWNANL